MSPRTRILAIYRGKLAENRGTPIRVRAILERLARDPRFAVTIASWDAKLPFSHVPLSNNKLSDARLLLRAACGADVVIGHTTATWYFLLLIRWVARRPIVLEMHGFIEEEARLYGDSNPLSYHFYKIVLCLLYRTARAITACSETAAQILRRYNRHVTTVYGGADTELFSPTVAPSAAVSRVPGKILVGYAGNARIWQGLDFLVEAYQELRTRDDAFELAILTSEKKGLPAGPGIQIVQGVPHEEVPQFLAACDILVIPRPDNEVNRISFPSKLIEYMAMGKPVVASATSDCHRVITNGADGRTYPPGDREALIGTLRSLKDEVTRTALGAAARATVLRDYTWEHQVALIADILSSVKK